MNFAEIIILAFGLSADAFAVAVCRGLNTAKTPFKKALIVGLYFGAFQAVMPVIGYYAASLFADKIISFDHWIAFALLVLLGVKMIIGSFKKDGCPDRKCPAEKCGDRDCPQKKEPSLKPKEMLPLALATSIDALAVGVSLAFLKTKIFPAIAVIGVVTLLMSMAGVMIGSAFGTKIKSKAEFIGGVILILIGIKILLEHYHVINF